MKNIAEKIFLTHLDIMKSVLDLGEYKLGADSAGYKYFKKVVMDSFYNGLNKCFAELKSEGILEVCLCRANLRHGYTDCTKCHGAGYVNANVLLSIE